MRWFAVAALILVIIPAAVAQQITDKLSLSQVHVVSGNPIGYISGIAHNNTDHVLNMAAITYNLLDAQGNLVGNAMAQAFNIQPGQSWQFKADTTVAFARFQLSGVIAN